MRDVQQRFVISFIFATSPQPPSVSILIRRAVIAFIRVLLQACTSLYFFLSFFLFIVIIIIPLRYYGSLFTLPCAPQFTRGSYLRRLAYVGGA